MKPPATRPSIAIISLLFCFGIVYLILTRHADAKETILIQVLSFITVIVTLILNYYFGATHKGTTDDLLKPKTKKMKQVFWEIPSLQLEVSAIPGILLTPSIPTMLLPDSYPEYEIGTDDTGTDVLMVTSEIPVTITVNGVNYTSAVAEFIGSKPRRPR